MWASTSPTTLPRLFALRQPCCAEKSISKTSAKTKKNEFRENLFTEHLSLEELEVDGGNAILDEQHDFVLSIRAGHQPHVTGQQALKSITVAEQILEKIAAHRWTSIAAGPSGPFFTPEPTIFSRPHKTPAVPGPAQGIQRKAG